MYSEIKYKCNSYVMLNETLYFAQYMWNEYKYI